MRLARGPHDSHTPQLKLWAFALCVMLLTACGPADPIQETYIVVTSATITASTTPLATSITVMTPAPTITLTPPLPEAVTASQTPATVCAEAPTVRLGIGMRGRVTITNGLPVNVRQNHGIGGTLLSSMPEGTAFTVTDGPQCADSMWWWKIDTGSGITGWAAEGDNTGYFLEPSP